VALIMEKILQENRKIFKKCKVTNAREAQLTDTEAESASQSQKNQSIKKGKQSISRISCSRMTPKNFTETWAQRIYRPENPHLWKTYSLNEVNVGRKSTA